MLAAGAAGAEGVYAQIRGIQRHLFGFVRFGQNGDGACAGVDPTLCFGHWDALHAVAARFEFQPRVDIVALDAENDFLVPTQVAGALTHQLGLPAAAFAMTQVHSREISSEEGRFVAACARADFDEGVARVVRVARQQRSLQLVVQTFDIGTRFGDLLLRHLGHVGVFQHRGRVAQVAFALLEAAEFLDQSGDLRVLTREVTEALHVARDGRIAERRIELTQAQREALELLAERVFHAGPAGRSAKGRRVIALRAAWGRR